MSEDSDRKGKSAPGVTKPAAKTVLGMPAAPDPHADPSDLERTRELPPGSRVAAAWPRPSPSSLRPTSSPPGSATLRPSLGGDLFPGLSRLSSRPPAVAAGAKAQTSQRPAPLPEAPPPPAPSAEEISASALVADDSGPTPALEAEELSGSVLVEEPAGGDEPPVVTRLFGGPHHAQQPGAAPAPAEPAHRALLGMPELPRSTPGPVLGVAQRPGGGPAVEHAQAQEHGAGTAASNEPGYTDAGPAGESSFDPAEVQAAAPPGGYAPPLAMNDDVEVTRLPRGPIEVVLERSRELLGRARKALLSSAEETPGRSTKPRWLVPAVVAGLAGVGLVVLVFAASGHDKGKVDAAAAQPSTVASARPAPGPAASGATPSSVAPASLPTVPECTVAAPAHVISPAAIVAAGVEVRSFGDAVALGFAPDDHEARVVRLDPASLAPTATATARASEPVRRVRPVVGAKETLAVAVDVDHKRDRVHARRTLPLDPPLQVGAVGNDVVWTHPGGAPAGKLWTLAAPEGSDEIDALRAASEGEPGDTTTAIAFRRGSSIWVGTATGYRSLAPKGDLSHMSGLGPAIGSPAVAVNEGVVVVAWADRPSSETPWRLRMVHMKAGDPPGEPTLFEPPAGGPGGHVMSPGVAAVPGGRFLLVWTEGPTSQQRVRAITLSGSGYPVGKALEISNGAVNSGQGQAAVTAAPGARGVVAFLQAADGGFEVAATAIACGP